MMTVQQIDAKISDLTALSDALKDDMQRLNDELRASKGQRLRADAALRRHPRPPEDIEEAMAACQAQRAAANGAIDELLLERRHASVTDARPIAEIDADIHEVVGTKAQANERLRQLAAERDLAVVRAEFDQMPTARKVATIRALGVESRESVGSTGVAAK